MAKLNRNDGSILALGAVAALAVAGAVKRGGGSGNKTGNLWWKHVKNTDQVMNWGGKAWIAVRDGKRYLINWSSHDAAEAQAFLKKRASKGSKNHGHEVLVEMLGGQRKVSAAIRHIGRSDPSGTNLKVLRQVMDKLESKLELKDNEMHAVKRLHWIVKTVFASPGASPDVDAAITNNLFKAANSLGLDLPHSSFNRLPSVHVKFRDPRYNFVTSVSAKTTEAQARKYFVGMRFDVGSYPQERLEKVVDIEYTPAGSGSRATWSATATKRGVRSEKAYLEFESPSGDEDEAYEQAERVAGGQGIQWDDETDYRQPEDIDIDDLEEFDG